MKKHKIVDIRHLTNSTFVVRMEKNGLEFQTGQFVLLSRENLLEQREYSVYSGETDEKGDFYGRVTDYLFTQKPDPKTNYFLCGNSEMIHEVFDILTVKRVPVSNIYSEVYF